jgi:hypothetical protein
MRTAFVKRVSASCAWCALDSVALSCFASSRCSKPAMTASCVMGNGPIAAKRAPELARDMLTTLLVTESAVASSITVLVRCCGLSTTRAGLARLLCVVMATACSTSPVHGATSSFCSTHSFSAASRRTRSACRCVR